MSTAEKKSSAVPSLEAALGRVEQAASGANDRAVQIQEASARKIARLQGVRARLERVYEAAAPGSPRRKRAGIALEQACRQIALCQMAAQIAGGAGA